MANRTKQEISIRIKAGWSAFGKYREIFLDRHLLMRLKGKVSNQCVLPAMTFGCQTWSLTKALVKKLEKKPTSMEKKMLNVKIKDRIRNTLGKEHVLSFTQTLGHVLSVTHWDTCYQPHKHYGTRVFSHTHSGTRVITTQTLGHELSVKHWDITQNLKRDCDHTNSVIRHRIFGNLTQTLTQRHVLAHTNTGTRCTGTLSLKHWDTAISHTKLGHVHHDLGISTSLTQTLGQAFSLSHTLGHVLSITQNLKRDCDHTNSETQILTNTNT